MSAENWEWFGHAAHCIIGPRYQFHLATVVRDKLILTIGEYVPLHNDSEVNPEASDKYESLGLPNEYFETMVFEVDLEIRCDCGCNMPTVKDWMEIEGKRYETRGEAQAGHMEMCRKYDK